MSVLSAFTPDGPPPRPGNDNRHPADLLFALCGLFALAFLGVMGLAVALGAM